ncbi:hypothetical protein ACJJH9_11285 [Microbulbifer sp. DLAB2-AF]|uniref:hypothetical protein n=1 Tax=Microbulbifer sp. DLAB2-AF TaxID=3243395 RepID=UPI004039B039
MNKENLITEFEELERKHRVSRVVSLFIAIAFVFSGILGPIFLQAGLFPEISANLIFAALGGSLVGYTALCWSGSNELKALRVAIQLLEEKEGKT